MITASLVDANTYEVVVSGGTETVHPVHPGDGRQRGTETVHHVHPGDGRQRGTQTVHRVRMSPDYYRKLCGSTVTHEWVLIQAFRFLLEREPNTAILKDFDLPEINRYFPEFEDEIAKRLGR